MLFDVFTKLNDWMTQENQAAIQEGHLGINPVQIKIIGQAALLEAQLSFDITATMDVDTYCQLEYHIQKKFKELLAIHGLNLDPLGHEAWMPLETEFKTIFQEQYVTGLIAEPVFIIISKAKMAPHKNRNLIINYLASSDLDNRIFDLAKKYQIHLESFL